MPFRCITVESFEFLPIVPRKGMPFRGTIREKLCLYNAIALYSDSALSLNIIYFC
jgi:hypothetical protein